MGGLLALILAARFPIERVALAAPALKARNPFIPLTPILKFLLPGVPSAYREQSDDPERQYLAREYWQWNATRPVAELYALQRRARRLLPRVHAAVLTLVSREDETVPLEVAELIERRCGSTAQKRVVLEQSPHVMVDGQEKARVADEIIRWFR
jgi:carboxylesterase